MGKAALKFCFTAEPPDVGGGVVRGGGWNGENMGFKEPRF